MLVGLFETCNPTLVKNRPVRKQGNMVKNKYTDIHPYIYFSSCQETRVQGNIEQMNAVTYALTFSILKFFIPFFSEFWIDPSRDPILMPWHSYWRILLVFLIPVLSASEPRIRIRIGVHSRIL